MVAHLLHSFLSLPSSSLNLTEYSSRCYSCVLMRKNGRKFQRIRASDREQQDFEIDQAKAREALRMFDEQLKSYSQKQIPTPKIKATSMNTERNQITTDELDDILQGPFLGNLTFVLLLFTIFYNIFYFTVLEPRYVRLPGTPATEERIPLMEL